MSTRRDFIRLLGSAAAWPRAAGAADGEDLPGRLCSDNATGSLALSLG
jgi:hypothetical protein